MRYPPANNSLLQSNGAPPNSVTDDNPPMREIANAAKSDFAIVTVTQEWGADVGSASCIREVLAAVAGAVTAGAVAWLWIGRRPENAAWVRDKCALTRGRRLAKEGSQECETL